MPGPEASEERALDKRAKAQGWLVRKVTFLGVRGAPDKLYGKGGRGVWIEWKAPDGGTISEQQAKRHRELREEFGSEVHVCRTEAEGAFVLGLL